MKKVLTIAGADPSGLAGIQSDLRTFEDFSLMGLSAITSLTAQNRKNVKAALVVPPAFLKKEITTLLEEFEIAAIKIGMLGSKRNASMLASLIRKKNLNNIVLDPVLNSTGGFPLFEKKGIEALKSMLPLVTVVTPNIPEASIISSIRIKNIEDMKSAARKIFSLGPKCVLIKGGHLKGDPVDILYDGKSFRYYKSKRMKAGREALHGTGCILSSAIAAGLAKGKPINRAVTDARTYLKKTISKRSRMD